MKIYLLDQNDKLEKHLELLKTKQIMPFEKTKLSHKLASIQVHTKKNLDELNLDFLFAYHIFPAHIMSHQCQWQSEKRNMKIGDTIAQQVYIPPTQLISQKIVFGVRITEIINSPHRKGFSYATLEGHVEKGISTFTVEQHESKIVFIIETFSAPGHILSKLLGSIFTIPYQTFCTNQALKNVKKILESR